MIVTIILQSFRKLPLLHSFREAKMIKTLTAGLRTRCIVISDGAKIRSSARFVHTSRTRGRPTIPGIDGKARQAMFVEKKSPEIIVPVEAVIANDESLQSPDYFQVHDLFTVRDLFDARVHLGHKLGGLSDRMKPFVFGHRFGTVIFDLDKTAFHLRQALNFTAHIAYRQGIILFMTRSAATINLVEKTAIEAGEYAHTREWETAILTNSTDKFGGQIRSPDLIIFMNTLNTVMAPHKGVQDAAKMMIPTIGIVDSNCDPSLVTYPVPGNDDSLSAVELYCKLFKEAIRRGKEKRQVNLNRRSKLNDSTFEE